MKRAILQSQQPEHPAKIADFDASCFDGCYVTGDITPQFLQGLAVARGESRGEVVGADQ